MNLNPPSPALPVPRPVVGIDVGGPKKGFHAIALLAGAIPARLHTRDVAALAQWIRALASPVVAIDAPCRWSAGGGRRLAEQQISRAGTACFATPVAERSGIPFYDWMHNGMALYAALQADFPLFDGRWPLARPVTVETFPQAVACALAGKVVPAKAKATVRPALLQALALPVQTLANIDWIDATLCAVAAQALLAGEQRSFGDAQEGFLVVPRGAWPDSVHIPVAPGADAVRRSPR